MYLLVDSYSNISCNIKILVTLKRFFFFKNLLLYCTINIKYTKSLPKWSAMMRYD